MARLQNALNKPDRAIHLAQAYLRHDLDRCDRLSGKVVLADALVATDRLQEAEATIEDALQDAEASEKHPRPCTFYWG